MDRVVTLDLVWWVTVVEVPVLTGLFWLIWRTRRDNEDELQRHKERTEKAVVQAREALAAYKLEVAKTYAAITDLKDVEHRLTKHLLRIEAKLDDPTRAITSKQGERRP